MSRGIASLSDLKKGDKPDDKKKKQNNLYTGGALTCVRAPARRGWLAVCCVCRAAQQCAWRHSARNRGARGD
jgi:hypothetical protein